MAADPVPKQLGFASIALSLPKTYMETDGPAGFAYEVGKDVGIGYAAGVTGAAAAAAAEGSALGPWGAAGFGFAVGLITAVGLDESFKQAERAVAAGLGAASEELAIAYGRLDREITNLYMRNSL